MRSTRMLLAMGLLAAVSMTGCKNSTKQENAMLKQENADLKAQLDDRNKALEDLTSEKRSLEQQLAQVRKDGGTDISGLKNADGVTWSQGAGEVTASIQGDVLFDSGKTTLKSAAKKSLDSVASVITGQYTGKSIRVSGFTDSDQIKKSGYKSNYHLGFERAYAVREYLISKGISPKEISLASYGPDVPKGSKAQSRRVEVSVIMN